MPDLWIDHGEYHGLGRWALSLQLNALVTKKHLLLSHDGHPDTTDQGAPDLERYLVGGNSRFSSNFPQSCPRTWNRNLSEFREIVVLCQMDFVTSSQNIPQQLKKSLQMHLHVSELMKNRFSKTIGWCVNYTYHVPLVFQFRELPLASQASATVCQVGSYLNPLCRHKFMALMESSIPY